MLGSLFGGSSRRTVPSILRKAKQNRSIMQVRIARSRFAGEPPNVLITPQLGKPGLLGDHRAADAIVDGRRAASAVLPQIRRLVQR